jgi:Uma2 family endonuclease
VQPDISVVCDRSKLDDHGCVGAPDLVIEILSSSTSRYDRVLKFNAYLRAGVREYWIVDPEDKSVSAHILDNGRYLTSVYGDTGHLSVHVLPGCEINLNDIFAEL